MQVFWSLGSTDRFVVQTWSDEAVVYDSWSSDTHLLEPLAVAVLHLLGAGRLLRQDILSALSDLFGTLPDDNLAEQTDATLSNLQHIGLIHTITLETR